MGMGQKPGRDREFLTKMSFFPSEDDKALEEGPRAVVKPSALGFSRCPWTALSKLLQLQADLAVSTRLEEMLPKATYNGQFCNLIIY